MPQVGYISPDICVEHDTGPGHPESSLRLQAINAHLHKIGLIQDLNVMPARPADMADVKAAHLPRHVDEVVARLENGARALDGDTTVSAASLDAAYAAAGSALTGLDAIASGKHKRVFCGVRPPGHHAESRRAMGFCIFNNVAVAAQAALSQGLAERVFILDWDVHHGNGTQEIFETSDKVYFYSTHQYPFYPGTGAESETGLGAGRGFTRNRPMAAGSGDDDYLRILEKDLDAIGAEFKPDLVIISAGFDAHDADPLGSMHVSSEGFAAMTRMATAMANQSAGGRVLSLLEGGYNLNALADSVAKHIEALGA